jgi:Tfp pilus assembly protein PilF
VKQSIRTAAQLACVVGATVAAYANTLRVPLFFDDTINIVKNPAIQSLSNFLSPARLIDASSFSANLKYATAVRPVAYLTFALNYALGGDDPVGYHVVNLAIHLISALLVYALTRSLLATPAFSGRRASEVDPRHDQVGEWASFFTALLFACHPLQTQAVTYITQRFASLAAMFYLGAALCYVRWRLRDERPGMRVAALALALLAATTKELSATLPAVLLVLEIVFFGSSLRSAGRRVWPFLLPVAAIPLLMLYVGRHAGTASVQDFVARGQNVAHPLDYLLTQPSALVMYLRLLAWPAHLNFDYDYPLYHAVADARVIGSAVLLLALTVGAIIVLARARKRGGGSLAMVGFGVLWFMITSSVESSFIPLADLAEEYRCYLPSVGFVWALVFAGLAVVDRGPVAARRAAVAGLGIAAVALGVATYARNDVYRDEVTLWEDVVAKSPLKSRPHTNLSVAYAQAGREEDSILQYQAAAYLNPEFRKAHGRLGVNQEEFEQAMRGAAASFAQGHVTKGIAALEKSDVGQAETEFRAALRLDPDSADAHSALGFIHVRRRELGEAVRENWEAVRLAPKRADLLRNLGLALYWSGKASEALEIFGRAVAIDPGDAESKRMIEQLSGRQSSSR